MQLPTDEEVRAWAGIDPGAPLDERVRRQGVAALVAQRTNSAKQAAARAASPEPQVLSRNTYPHPDGTLVVSVVLIPNESTKENPAHV